MENQITKRMMDIVGPVTDGKLAFGGLNMGAAAGGYDVTALTDEQKVQVEQLVIDHFKVKKVLWMEIPSGLTEDGEQAIVAKTHKLVDEDYETYEGKTAYVYQILFTPKMHDPKTVHNAVKDGCTMTPIIYNPETFTPYRKIVLTWSLEQAQDFSVNNSEEAMKQTLRDQLEKVLANPEEYMHEGFRACMLRFAAK
jgi:hypothetical protein